MHVNVHLHQQLDVQCEYAPAFPTVADNFRIIIVNQVGNFTVSETVTGTNSGATAVVKSWDDGGNILVVENPTAYFETDERITGATSSAVGDIQSSTNVYFSSPKVCS